MDNIRLYKKIIQEYPLLDAAKETELLSSYKNGDKTALDVIVKSNLRLVISCAKSYAPFGADISDLIQEGCIGLQKAVEKFDTGHGVKLSTYAVAWIRQAIGRYVKSKTRQVTLPENLVNVVAKIVKYENSFSSEIGRMPSVPEISAATGFSETLVTKAKRVSAPAVSMQAKLGEDGEVGQLMQDDSFDSPVETADKSIMMDNVVSAAERLSPVEQTVMRFRYGLCCNQGLTVEQCAKTFNVPESKISEILKHVQ